MRRKLCEGERPAVPVGEDGALALPGRQSRDATTQHLGRELRHRNRAHRGVGLRMVLTEGAEPLPVHHGAADVGHHPAGTVDEVAGP